MKKITLLVFLLISSLALSAQSKKTTIAVLSDTHQGAFASAEKDLKESIADINKNPDIDLVIISGDITEFGTDDEIQRTKDVVATLTKKYLFVPGNHDTNWSESGCTSFNKIMGGSQFEYMYNGMLFIGISSGPYMRMGPCQAPREDIEWLQKVLARTDKDVPIVFTIHAPLKVDNIANYDQIIDLLKTRNIQFVLCGHGHSNKHMNFEGIQGIMVRSNLSRQDPCGGYTIVTLDQGKAVFSEKRPLEDTLRTPWLAFDLKRFNPSDDTKKYSRPDFSKINSQYPQVKQLWHIQDVSDIASGTVYENGVIYYTNTIGQVVAIREKDAKKIWTFSTGDKIFSTPSLYKGRLYISSTDGSVYCLDPKKGRQIWEYSSLSPIMSTPNVVDDVVYVGGGKGQFYAIDATTGREIWVYHGIKGYTESRPAVWGDMVFIGSWGAEFYAFNKKTGDLAWKYAPGVSRYYSPGACSAEVSGNSVFVQSSDKNTYNFDTATGNIIWKSDKPVGRESMGISPDKKTIYVKSTKNNVVAIDALSPEYKEIWVSNAGLGAEFGPTKVVATQSKIFIPTAGGKVLCLDAKDGKVEWAHQFSNTLITSTNPVGNDKLIVTTMDGGIFYMQYK